MTSLPNQNFGQGGDSGGVSTDVSPKKWILAEVAGSKVCVPYTRRSHPKPPVPCAATVPHLLHFPQKSIFPRPPYRPTIYRPTRALVPRDPGQISRHMGKTRGSANKGPQQGEHSIILTFCQTGRQTGGGNLPEYSPT